jgi:Na+/H+ antiporter NhaA
MFWIGLIIGLFIGTNVGLFVFALFASKKESGACKSYDSEFSEAWIRCI